MKRIFVVQFRARPEMLEAERAEYKRATGEGAEIEFESALNTAREWDAPQKILAGFDGIILGGSGEFDLHGGREENDTARVTAREVLGRMKKFVSYTVQNDIPVLGICFGHQVIAEIYSGNVTNDHLQKKVGSFEVNVLPEGKQDLLFQTVPSPFIAQYGHKDSVTSLPQGATLLATGPACKFSALRYGSKIYSTQFHPELTAKDVAWKLANSPGYLPEGVSVESIVKESPEASKIIPLWIEKIV